MALSHTTRKLRLSLWNFIFLFLASYFLVFLPSLPFSPTLEPLSSGLKSILPLGKQKPGVSSGYVLQMYLLGQGCLNSFGHTCGFLAIDSSQKQI